MMKTTNTMKMTIRIESTLHLSSNMRNNGLLSKKLKELSMSKRDSCTKNSKDKLSFNTNRNKKLLPKCKISTKNTRTILLIQTSL